MQTASEESDATPGATLRELRLSHDLSQVELAVRAGVSLNTIYSAEKGKIPQPLTQARIARAVGVDRHEIWPDAA